MMPPKDDAFHTFIQSEDEWKSLEDALNSASQPSERLKELMRYYADVVVAVINAEAKDG